MSVTVRAGTPDTAEHAPTPPAEWCTVIIFGATGDLTRRKLLPALYGQCFGSLGSRCEIIGTGRTPQSGKEFRARMRGAAAASQDGKLGNDPRWPEFEERLSYLAGNPGDPAFYPRRNPGLTGAADHRGARRRRLGAEQPRLVAHRAREAVRPQQDPKRPENACNVCVECLRGEDPLPCLVEVRAGHGEIEMSHREPTTDADLDKLQHESFNYFLYEANAANGLVIDKTAPDWPASIAAIGLALAAYPVGVERGYVSRAAAVDRTLRTLRFFWNSPQGPEPDATGYQGFYYHFLDMQTGRRAWQCELSTVDSTFLLAGALAAGLYFAADTSDEREIRSLADALYRRADWQWAQNGGSTVTHGWTPENGFLQYRWEGYDEALLLYVLGLGSPTHPLPETSYSAWCSTYKWERIYGQEYLYAGPLSTHQFSHIWIDFRGIQDAFMRDKGIDYFENSRRATYVQQQYAIDNPLKFEAYGRDCWGISASEGPGPKTMKINGIERQFFDYVGRGVPYGPDDGTIAPWAAVASLPFAPEIVLPVLGYCIHEAKLTESNPYGFKASFNPTFPEKSGNPHAWVSPWHFGLNQGPIILMIENHRTGFLWRLTRHCPYLASGLRRAGFAGGWL